MSFLDVDCPTCGAQAGAVCLSADILEGVKEIKGGHKARRQLFSKQTLAAIHGGLMIFWCADCVCGRWRVESGLCEFCGKRMTLEPLEEMEWDWAPLSPPGPLSRVQLDCTWPAGPLRSMQLSALAWPGPRSCFSHEGQQCARGDDSASCPYAVWLELDCAGPGADCEGQLVEALPEDAGTELEGVAQLLSDVWSFVDGDDDPEAYVWETIRVGRSPHQLAHTRWVRESAARFMARARITTGNCEGPSCAC